MPLRSGLVHTGIRLIIALEVMCSVIRLAPISVSSRTANATAAYWAVPVGTAGPR